MSEMTDMSEMKDLPEPTPDVAHPRVIRTFVRRAGRTTTGQARAFADLGPSFLLPFGAAALDAPAGVEQGEDEEDHAAHKGCGRREREHREQRRGVIMRGLV